MPELFKNIIFPQLPSKAIESAGSTNKALHQIVRDYRTEQKIPKSAKLKCHSGKEALSALTRTIQSYTGMPSGETFLEKIVIIQGQSWKISAISHFSDMLAFQEITLKEIIVSKQNGIEELICIYMNASSGHLRLTRPLRSSDWMIKIKGGQLMSLQHRVIAQVDDGLFNPYAFLYILSNVPSTEPAEMLYAQEPRQ